LETIMSKSVINRRQFLETGGRTVAGGIAVTSLTTLTAAGSAWAVTLTVFDNPTAEVLVAVCRVLYPHDRLNDDYYMNCVETLDAKAANDSDLARQIIDGVAKLDGSSMGRFLDLIELEQVKVLAAMEETAFFRAIRGHMVTALYNNPKVWRELGYQGPSFPYGGYLERGFNDIDWI